MILRTNDKKARKTVRYVAGFVILLILVSFIYQWNNGLEIDTTERVSFILVLTSFLSTFLPVRKKLVNNKKVTSATVNRLYYIYSLLHLIY